MSIRGDAKALGISDSFLSRLLSGKRRWTPELYEKYLQLQLGNFGSTFTENPPNLATNSAAILLAKKRVVGSNPIFRSNFSPSLIYLCF